MRIKNNQQFTMLSPHPALKRYVLHYNLVFPARDTFAARYTLMPNACGTLSLAFDGNDVICELWGASVTPTLLGTEPGGYEALFLIQLSACGLYQITRQSQLEFADKRLSLSDIDRPLCRALHQAFFSAETADALASACDAILSARTLTPIVAEPLLLATRSISDHHGHIQVREVARLASYSERHLSRLFQDQIGTTIKGYTRLARFTYVLGQMQTSPCFLAALSQKAGYYDQPHFDKDFKAISGMTPQAYLENMSDFYYDGVDI